MYYCGVCKSIGREYSQLSRFGLVYEAAVLAMILNFASGNVNKINKTKSNCIAHPFKKSYFIDKCDSVDYAASVNVFLMYFKLQDNWQDDKSILSLTGKKAIQRGFKKASRIFPIAADSIFFSINDLNLIEKKGSASIDEASEPFSYMMSCLFKWLDSDCFTDNNLKLDLLGKIGYNVGKWIYIIDAVSDIKQDAKNNNYNVLLKNKIQADDVKFILELCLANCAKAYEELVQIISKETNTEDINYINSKGVIDNLFYIGMRHITEMKVGNLHESI